MTSSESVTPHLTCSFKTLNENGDAGKETTSGRVLLCQEAGKKSSYLLQPKQCNVLKNDEAKEIIDWYPVPKPAHLVVENNKFPTTASSFFFGGLQLVFDAKNIEIYLTTPEGKESYLMTCKGIPYKVNGKENFSQESESTPSQKVEWRRALCVVPGGPRCISSLRIKLVGSASTSDSPETKVQFLKLTARIVDNSSSSSSRSPALKSSIAASIPQGIKGSLPNSNANMLAPSMPNRDSSSYSEPPLTQKDLGAAMAGLSFMARKTEENMANLFTEHSKRMEKQLETYLAQMELQMRALKPTLAMQHQLIKENQIIMTEQQKIMNEQTSQISKLLSDNQDLQVRVQSLQADVTILRSQSSYDNTSDDVDVDNDVDASESKAIAQHPSSKDVLVDADHAPPDDLGDEKKKIAIENAHLRNVIQNVAQGIDGEPLLGGCGGTESANYAAYASLGMDDTDIELENIRLKNTIRNISRGIDEEPLLTGCRATPTIYPENAEMATENLSHSAVDQTARDIEEIAHTGGCGNIFQRIEDDIVREIIKSKAVSLDTTRAIKNIQQKYSDEYTHTPNIEVELMQEDRVQEGDDENQSNGEAK